MSINHGLSGNGFISYVIVKVFPNVHFGVLVMHNGHQFSKYDAILS